MTTATVRAALLLSNRLVRLDTAPLKAREFWSVVAAADALGIAVGELLGDATRRAEVAERTGSPDLTDDRLGTLLDATRAFAFETERLDDAGIHVISALDERFPTLLRDRMADGCPPHLFAAGATVAPEQPTLSIVGEDTATSEALAETRQAVAAAVVAGWTVATPNSAGPGDVASVVLDEAVACEASLVLLAAAGINRVAREPALRKLVQGDAISLMSPFAPDAPEAAATTRARNAMMHAIGTLTLVVACDDGTGPIWSAAFDAVQREPGSVVVLGGPGAAAGNLALVELGARAVADPEGLAALFA